MMIPFHFHIETPFLKKQPLFLKISERAALLYVFANLRDTDLVKKKARPPQKKHPNNNQLDSLICFCTREMPSSRYKKWQWKGQGLSVITKVGFPLQGSQTRGLPDQAVRTAVPDQGKPSSKGERPRFPSQRDGPRHLLSPVRPRAWRNPVVTYFTVHPFCSA